ncbi:MAG: DUF1810 domain-containing protein [Beijerinckiaceae bacterium]
MGSSSRDFNLQRFKIAQDKVLDSVLNELRAGKKTSHWMWFIFPQISGMSESPTSRHFAISSISEARAFIEHPVLGPRLIECAEIVNRHAGKSIADIFGYPDDMKFHACVTLFGKASEHPVFNASLELFFNSTQHAKTIQKLQEDDV